MRFDDPRVLSFIPAAVLALALLHAWAAYRRNRMLARFGDPQTVRKLARSASPARRNIKFAMTLTAAALLLFALARPQYGAVERPLRRRGVEVVIAMDCSLSMLGQDIKPNRFERARGILRELIQSLQGDQIGIVAFAGIAVTQCPMTADYTMALHLLDALSVDTVPVQGTSLARAVRKAAAMFKTAGAGNRILVLLTDGEDHEGDALKAAEEAAAMGVRIYAIGIGSPEGAPVPLPEGGYKEMDGSKINSRLDFDTLRKMAFATGGKAILANPAGRRETDEIAKDIAGLKETDITGKTLVVHEERFQYFLFPAILLLASEMLWSDRRRKIQTPGTGRFD